MPCHPDWGRIGLLVADGVLWRLRHTEMLEKLSLSRVSRWYVLNPLSLVQCALLLRCLPFSHLDNCSRVFINYLPDTSRAVLF